MSLRTLQVIFGDSQLALDHIQVRMTKHLLIIGEL